MSFFSEERLAELRDLFFESAQELLQALNEEGLELEKHPGDADIVRRVRRTVHTLKGDSAAVGYRELSELAHQLEDVLTPEIASVSGPGLAEVVLSAADVFDGMLAAYRSNLQPPAGDALRAIISKLAQQPSQAGAHAFAPAFGWNEYERLIIAGALDRGRKVFNIGVRLDSACGMRAAALQLLRNAMQEAGSVLAFHPEDSAAIEKTDTVEAALSSEQTPEWIARKCQIPAVVADLAVEPYSATGKPVHAEPEVPDPAERPETDVHKHEPHPSEQANPDHGTGAPEPPKSEAARPMTTDNILRVDAERIDAALDLMGELIIAKSMLHQAFNEFSNRFPKDPLRGRFADAMAFQARVMGDLQRSVTKIRMVPVEQLFRRFPRLVRDVCKQRNKDVELVITGEDTDLDKSILDALAEPLAHLVRNAVDHGIEGPEERVAAGKPARGTVRLNAYHHGNQIIIEVSDDGRGIDHQKVLKRAVEKGTIGSAEAARLTTHEALNLIFESGVSTAERVTEISGRGVGMDVVRSVLEGLKGTIAIETTLGAGTTFLLKVPLTLAIIKALLFRVNERLYAVPLNSVLEITRVAENEVHRVDFQEVIQLRDQVMTLVRLGRLTPGHSNEPSPAKMFVVVIGMADRRFGLVVDKLVGEEELVIKALDDKLVATELVSGASILGDGRVVLILNMSAVVEHIARLRSRVAAASTGVKA